ncbi:MAG: DUF1206 domain-containing protein [Sphingomonadaceae bacterium]
MNRVTQLENFARAGYLARAVVYVLLGYFALTTAGGGSEGTTDVLQQIKDVPAGSVLLILVAIGLFGYGVFRLYGAAIDIQGEGSDFKGAGKRIGHAASGLAHLVLAFLAAKFALGEGGSGKGGGQGSAEAAQTASQFPGGETLLYIIGIGLLLAGLNQLVKAATGKFMALLDANAPSLAEILGRLGFAARAVVFGVIGWQVISTASGDSERIGIGPALNALRDTGWLYMLVAAGLLLFGLFSLVMARYRRIRNEDVLRRLRGEAARAV